MTKKQKIATIILVIILLALSGIGALYFKQKKNNPVPVIKQEDLIKEYNYAIKENDSKVKKEKFKELKEILDKEPIDKEEYAKKLAEIFTVDVYDLDSKINKYDVGGLEYILEAEQEKFKLVLQDSLYSNIKDNTSNDRKQQLPVVKSATAKEITSDNYTYQNADYSAYLVNVLIDYDKDLGYDKNVSVKIIEKDNKLFVVAVEPN